MAHGRGSSSSHLWLCGPCPKGQKTGDVHGFQWTDRVTIAQKEIACKTEKLSSTSSLTSHTLPILIHDYTAGGFDLQSEASCGAQPPPLTSPANSYGMSNDISEDNLVRCRNVEMLI